MIKFVLNIDTRFGQDMLIRIEGKQYPMTYEKDATWVYELKTSPRKIIKYQYILKDTDGSLLVDTPKNRYLPIVKTSKVEINDVFGYKSLVSVFQSKAFVDCIMRRESYTTLPTILKDDNMLMLFAPGIDNSQTIKIVGNHPILGYWEPKAGIELNAVEHGWWWIKLPNDNYLTHSEFKFVVCDKISGNVVKWEIGDNRRMPVLKGNSIISFAINIEYDWKGTGVAIPVFSLRSKSDWGVGQFSDLKLLADWAKKNNHKFIQILPINDTTASETDFDSYPYKANSVYALHPMYLDVTKIGTIADSSITEKYKAEAEQLNQLSQVNYSAVNKLKIEYAKIVYDQNYDQIVKEENFIEYVKTNQFWLKDYAAFSLLRNQFGSDNFSKWGKYSHYSKRNISKLCDDNKREIYFFYFLQYHLHIQLSDAINYIHCKGLAIKGDLPIGISAKSVDAWVNPTLFNLDKQAGAPPDDFSVKGQNWGFPTYNWSEMEHTQYNWWKTRFAAMEKYFDAFRIDHILGFFRIWEIPMHAVWGLLGHFSPALPLTIEEIENYGFGFDKKRMTEPYITKQLLDKLFGNDAVEVTSKFMNQICFDRYELKEEFRTQRKITDCFEKNGLIEKKPDLYNKLMELCCEVLFIEDDNKAGYYHPRINMYNTHSYNQLSQHEQWCLRSIHDDFFFHRHNHQWYSEAMRKLPALLNETNMLVCGEDLGMVPSCVPQVMADLQILSLEVERMPKKLDQRFTDISATPYLSVCCTGTHDTSTLRMWWQEDKNNTQWYYNNVMKESGEPPKALSAEMAKKIIDRFIKSSSMLVILPWQDYLACDAKNRLPQPEKERINNPANPNHIWCWRMHLNLDN